MSGYPNQGYSSPPQGGTQQNQGERPSFPGGFNFEGVSPQEQRNSTQGHTGPYNPPPTHGVSHGQPGSQYTSYGTPFGQTGGVPPTQTSSSHPPVSGISNQSTPDRAPLTQGGSPYQPESTHTHNTSQRPPSGAAACPPTSSGKPNRPAFDWVYASAGSIPPNAVQGGVEVDGKPLFIARQFYQGGLHVGKAGPHLRGISLGYDGKEINLKDYYVLCGDARQLRWVECHGICNPDNWRPIEAGHENDGKPLFVAKTRYAGGEHVGKVGSHLKGGMCFGYGGKEKTTKDAYYVLAYL